MDINENKINALLEAGKDIKAQNAERAAESAKLNAHDGWFGLQAFKREQSETAGKIFKANPFLEQQRIVKDAAAKLYEELKAKHEPEAYAALEQLAAIQAAMKAFILTGKVTEVSGVMINSLESCLTAYTGIKQRMTMHAQS